MTHPLSSAISAFFQQKSATFVISRNTDMDSTLIYKSGMGENKVAQMLGHYMPFFPVLIQIYNEFHAQCFFEC